MSKDIDLSKKYAMVLIELVEHVIDTYGNRLLSLALDPNISKSPTAVVKGNNKYAMDIEIDTYYRKRLQEILETFVYFSEESDPVVVGAKGPKDTNIIMIVDPLDTSEMAVRGLEGWTHLVMMDRLSNRVVASVVGDFFHPIKIYYAFVDDKRSGSYARTRDGREFKLCPSKTRCLRHALVTSFTMKPKERFLPIAKKKALFDELAKPDKREWRMGRIGLSFGSIGMCHVAAGLTDAFIEVIKGFRMVDLLPGLFILREAGGCIVDLSGTNLNPQFDLRSIGGISKTMRRRKKFIASGTEDLAKEIITRLH